jgi:hypothetical protein
MFFMNTLADYELKEVVKSDVFVDPQAINAIIDPTKVLLLDSWNAPDDRFSRPTRYHGRSIEDITGLVVRQEPLKDENGDIYTSFSIKGAEAAFPRAGYSQIDPSYVRVNGMLDASTFERVQKISQILREAGVLTEWPLFHARPKLLTNGESDIGLRPFRQMVYENYVKEQESLHVSGKSHKADSIGRAGLVGAGLVDMQFGVMYRAMLANARLGDLTEFQNRGWAGVYVADAIRSLQARQPDHFSAWDAIKTLDPASPEDHKHYLTNVLPRIMGENLARFHGTGSYHKYLHSGNWTLAGEIVDLDSVRNSAFEPDDEEDINVRNRVDEMVYASTALRNIKTDEVTSEKMWSAFRNAYFAERYIDEKIDEFESIVLESHFYSFKKDELRDLGLPRVVKLPDAELDAIINNGIREAVKSLNKSELANLGQFLVDIGLRDYVAERVDEFLEANNFKSVHWFDQDRLVQLELVRVIEALAQSIDRAA